MRIKYTTIIVRDMDSSVRFYKESLGFTIDSFHKPRPGVVITLMKGDGDAMIELIRNNVDEPGIFSVGMDVKDLNATVNGLRAQGVKIKMERMEITVGALAFIEDPNGGDNCFDRTLLTRSRKWLSRKAN
jgi:lactoylglutathione lyase